MGLHPSLVTLHRFARKQRRLVVALVWTTVVATAASSGQTTPGEPTSAYFVTLRRRRRSARPSPSLGLRGICSLARVARALLRLHVVVITALVCDSEPWTLLGLVTIELLGTCLFLAAVGKLGRVRLVRLAVELDRFAALMFFWTLAIILNQTGGSEESISPAFVGVGGLATVEVGQDRARIVIGATASLELSIEHEADERIAMVLCRLLKDSRGRPLMSHQQIADAFGKGSRQGCHNHIQQFDRAGASLARMVLEGRRGRPNKLHPLVLERIAHHWERNPLASLA